MKECCIIGATGFIGSSILDEIMETERNITVIGRTKNIKLDKSIKYISGNCLDFVFMEKHMQHYDEVIILCDFLEVYRKSLKYFRKKIKKLFLILSKTSISKIIMASSGGAIYGEQSVMPIKEEINKKPISDYGKEKLLIEKIGLDFFNKCKLPIIFIRPSNVYGVKQIPFTGQGFIATSLASIKMKKTIEIYGINGTIRDYIHVDDVAKSIVSLLDGGLIGEAYNIGTEIGSNNFKIIDIIKEITFTEDVRINIKAKRSMDVSANILDCSKIFNHIDWKHNISLSNGLSKIWNDM